jgi:hypothetical protein
MPALSSSGEKAGVDDNEPTTLLNRPNAADSHGDGHLRCSKGFDVSRAGKRRGCVESRSLRAHKKKHLEPLHQLFHGPRIEVASLLIESVG